MIGITICSILIIIGVLFATMALAIACVDLIDYIIDNIIDNNTKDIAKEMPNDNANDIADIADIERGDSHRET